MTIRKAIAADIARIVEIETRCFPTPWPRELLASYLGEDGFMVYEQDGAVIGYMILGIKIPSFLARLERRMLAALHGQEASLEENTGHIMNLAVDPPFRRRSIGSMLLQKGLEYLQSLGAKNCELEVRVNNEEAIELYRRFGFVIKEVIKNYYRNGDDAYLMAKRLA